MFAWTPPKLAISSARSSIRPSLASLYRRRGNHDLLIGWSGGDSAFTLQQMYLLYSLLLGIGILVLLPRFVIDAFRHGKYAAGLRERAGGLASLRTAGRPVIWLHCVSVGEAQAARPLFDALTREYPQHVFVVSTTTLTGQRVARDAFGSRAASVFYFPFDWAWSVRRVLTRVNPSAVLVMETELWPHFLRECGRRRIPVAVVNGRISNKSFKRYRRIGFFIRRVIQDLSLAIMQTEEDEQRINALGLGRDRIRISGNVKFDVKDEGGQPLTDVLRRRFRFDDDRALVVAASTHEPEERMMIDAFKRLVTSTNPSSSKARLLIAPRHPERFEQVAELLRASGLRWARRSAEAREDDASASVVLLDSIGELRAVYPLAEIVFVGGSLVPKGGHNVLEPALAGRCIVTGTHTFNFTQIVGLLAEHDAIVQVGNESASDPVVTLSELWDALLLDDERRRQLGEQARRVVEQNRGATARTIEMLKPIFEHEFPARLHSPVDDRSASSNA